MGWFNGSIAQAIAECHKTGKIFTVFIHEENDESNKMIQTWDDENVQSRVSEECISLKFQSGSEPCTQFSQIYPIVLLPITYLIGSNGVPLEIVGGFVTAEALIEKIQSAKQKMTSNTATGTSLTASLNSPSPLNNATQAAVQSPVATSLPGFSDDETAAVPTTSQTSSLLSTSEAQKKEAARLQELIKKRRAEKAMKESKANDLKEIERRKMGRSAQSVKDKHQDLLMKKELEERRRDAKRDKEARARVLEQIAQDRANENAAFMKEKQKRKEKEEKDKNERERKNTEMQTELAAERAKYARIQFRLPNGSKILRQYERGAILRSVIADLESQDIQLPPVYKLVTGIPPRGFSEDDELKTMEELDLCPNAALIVKPLAMKSNDGFLGQLVGLFMLLFSWPMQLISYLFGSSNGNKSTNSTNSSRASKSEVEKSSPAKDGKTYRLSDLKKKDDDQATWNGNSTQQM